MKSQVKIIPKSRKQNYAKYSHRLPKSRKEEAEFGLAQKEFLVCPDCSNVYFDKSWKHSFSEDKLAHFEKEKQFRFSICHACRMIKDKKYEGRVLLENAPEKFKKDILNTVANMAKQAYENDSQDRVWKVEEREKNIEILTTENQLAVRIAKKIQQTFGGNLKIQRSSGEDITTAKIGWIIPV